MKNLTWILLLFSFTALRANTYYVSSLTGDDKRSSLEAQNPATPWRSIGKVNSAFNIIKAGDSILFKRGETFKGSLTITTSGITNSPIVFSAFGSGSRPVISGFSTLKTWTLAKENIYTSYSSELQEPTNMVLVNNKVKPKGRYPNYGYMKIESTNGTSQIASSQLSGSPVCAGGEVVIRKNRWIIDRATISRQSDYSLNYFSDESSYTAATGFGFFIQNHINTLDRAGEWYFDNKKKQFGIFFGAQSPDLFSVQASTINTLVKIAKQSYLIFDNFCFKGANLNAFDINNSDHLTISNCEIYYSGTNAIDAANTDNLIIVNQSIKYTNNIALNLSSCSNAVVKGNKIRLTGTYQGMGQGGDGNYEALTINGDNNLIEQNIIDSTGYIPLNFRGNSVIIKNNYITNFDFVKDDGGGIYSWNNNDNAADNYGRQIIGNIILNGKGAGAGTDNPGSLPASGIYMDDNVSGVTISGNTVGNCSLYGLFIHNGHEIKTEGNTLYNNSRQVGMVHDNNATKIPIRNITSSNNIFFSKAPASTVAEFKTIGNDIPSFGVFNNNYYSRPLDNSLLVNASYVKSDTWNNKQLSLDGWKKTFRQDNTSGGDDIKIPSYKVEEVTSENKFSNGSFTGNINGLYAYAPAANCTVSWKNGVLDNGALQVAFSRLTGSSDRASIIIGIGAVKVGKSYLLKFSMKGTDENKAAEIFLRKSLSGYNDLSDRKYKLIFSDKTENELVFTPTVSEANASLVFNIEEQEKPLYIDNIQLYEANVTALDPNDFIRFEYNATANVKTLTLSGKYVDVKNNKYSKSVNLDPFTSLILLKPGSTGVDTVAETDSCSATGKVSFKQWKNVSGNDIADIPTQQAPEVDSQLSFLEYRDSDVNYGSSFSGYFCAPQSGDYTFFLAGDDAGELWLSTDDNPDNKTRIANFLSWTSFRQWNKFPSQQSVPVSLVKGHKYYLEVLHKQGAGGGHISVGCTLPDGTRLAPMPAIYFSPYDTSSTALLTQNITLETLADKTLGDTSFDLNASASSGLPVTFSIVSGPATIIGNTVTLTGTGTVVVKASQSGDDTYKAAYTARSFTVLPAQAAECSATGTILLEQWKPVTGNDVADIPLTDLATSKNYLSSLEFTDNSNNYGIRIRGYICPPQTGNYNFRIAGDDAAEVWLSTSADPSKKVKIASFLSWTPFRDFTVFSSQKSAGIFLKTGQKYYIEVLLKQGEGQDHVSVAWQMPDGTTELPIPGTRLSPYVSSSARKTNPIGENILNNKAGPQQKNDLFTYPNPVRNKATIVYNPSESGQINLVLSDINGRYVQAIFKGSVEKEISKTFMLNGTSLAAGTYVLSLTSRSNMLTQKIIVTK